MAKPTLRTLFILCACLCIFVLHNSAYYGIDTGEHDETLPLAETRGETDSSDSHTHTHEHEDGMTLLDSTAPHVLVGLASRIQRAYLSALALAPNPLLPPPKNQ